MQRLSSSVGSSTSRFLGLGLEREGSERLAGLLVADLGVMRPSGKHITEPEEELLKTWRARIQVLKMDGTSHFDRKSVSGFKTLANVSSFTRESFHDGAAACNA